MTAAIFSPPGLVPALTRAWVNLYCSGMSSEARSIRRLEIESDLWEHFADRTAEGIAPALVGVEAFSRLLRGVPSDIAWRFQAEGFHMNINIPIERIAGILLLFLIVPFIAGVSISGYDYSRDSWPSEFARFSNASSATRDATAYLHGLIGLLTIAGSAQLLAMLRDRSPRLITLSSAMLGAAGLVMLVNAAAYRAMSGLANDYAAAPNPAVLASARALGMTIETLAMANLAASSLGILALSAALARLAMVPSWTRWLPVGGLAGAVLWMVIAPSFGDLAWLALGIGWLAVAVWLLFCGMWLLFGGSKSLPSMKGIPAHVG